MERAEYEEKRKGPGDRRSLKDLPTLGRRI
jgi:hypothetical protein